MIRSTAIHVQVRPQILRPVAPTAERAGRPCGERLRRHRGGELHAPSSCSCSGLNTVCGTPTRGRQAPAHDPQPVELLRPVQGVGRAVTDQVLGERRRSPGSAAARPGTRTPTTRRTWSASVRFDGLGDVEGDLTVDERGAQIGVAVEVADAAHVGRQMEHELGADDRADRLGERRQVGGGTSRQADATTETRCRPRSRARRARATCCTGSIR